MEERTQSTSLWVAIGALLVAGFVDAAACDDTQDGYGSDAADEASESEGRDGGRDELEPDGGADADAIVGDDAGGNADGDADTVSDDDASVDPDAEAETGAGPDGDADGDARDEADESARDGDGDAAADVGAEPEAVVDPPGDTDAGTSCGDGLLGPGEECDEPAPRACTTACGTVGVRTCEACAWSACAPHGDFCNRIDDDCDPGTEDGSGDPAVGAPCDGPDLDLCPEGTATCAAGELLCSDVTGNSVETCNGLDDDCDSLTDEDFAPDNNPLCADGFWDLGVVSGDTGSDSTADAFWSEQWDFVTFREEDLAGSAPITGTISLYSPPGIDFDLYVYCLACGGTLAGASTVGGLDGHLDQVDVRRDDTAAADNLDVLIEIRHSAGVVCSGGDWSLTVNGATDVAVATCLPHP
ncbi:MAG: hypothetical protein HY905_11165 [Deltaproteobacteria bacterium]|nr:hypothetical protein [Deltaproteobacteria bacterium]